MSRRALATTLAFALLLVGALVPWTVSSERLTRRMARQVEHEFGLRLSGAEVATFALLPVPRIHLRGATLTDETGTVVIRQAQIRAGFRPLSFLTLQPRVTELSIAGARISVRGAEQRHMPFGRAPGWLRARMAEPGGGATWIGRLALTDSEVVLEGASAAERVELGRVNLLVRWPSVSRGLDLTASAVWRGEPVTFALSGLDPAALLDGRGDAVEASGTSRLGRVSLAGDLAWTDDLRFSGLATAETASVSGLVRWMGVGLDLAGIDRPLSITGAAKWTATGIEWPSVRIDLGPDRLDGALAVAAGGSRPSIRATLAGDRLVVGPSEAADPVSALASLAEAVRTGRPEADYDIRLSASTVQLGGLAWKDVAAAIMTNRDRVELSLARAMLADGALKGRLTVAGEGEGRDLRAQLTLERMDIAQLLLQSGAPRVLSGTLGGQLSLEAPEERRLADLARKVKGRVTLVARDGDIAGLALGEAPRRPDPRPGFGPVADWRGGRTRFGQAQLSLSLGDGVAEIVEGNLDNAATQTALRGRFSLVDRTLALRTVTRPNGTGPEGGGEEGQPAVALDIRGPLDQLTVTAVPPPPADQSASGPEPRPVP